MTTVPGVSTRSGRMTLAPERKIMCGRSSERLLLVVDVPLELAAVERKRCRSRRAKELPIDLLHQLSQPALVGREEDDHAGTFVWRKPAIIDVVTIERDQRPANLF